MIARRSLLLGAVATALVPRVVLADDSTLDALLAKITKARASLRSLSGPFVQTRKIGLLSSSVRSTGSILFAAPIACVGPRSPDDVTYWVSKRGLAYRTKEGGGASRGRRASSPMRSTICAHASAAISRSSARATRSRSSRGARRRALSDPEGHRQRAHSHRDRARPDLVRPVRVTLAESAKDKTDVVFGALVVNGPVDQARLHPPT